MTQSNVTQSNVTPWDDCPNEPTDGDITAVAYRWLRAATDSRAEAEELTIEVFRRAQLPQPGWLDRLPTLVRLKVLVAQTVLAHRDQGVPLVA